MKFIVGEASSVSPNSVQIRRPVEGIYTENSNLEDIPFDALVVATGVSYPVFKVWFGVFVWASVLICSIGKYNTFGRQKRRAASVV